MKKYPCQPCYPCCPCRPDCGPVPGCTGATGPMGPQGVPGPAASFFPGQYVTANESITYTDGNSVQFFTSILESTAFTHPNSTDFIVQIPGVYLVNFYLDLASITGGTGFALAINGVPTPVSAVSVSAAGSYSGSSLLIVLPGDVVSLQNIGSGAFTTSGTSNASARISIIQVAGSF